MKFGLFKLVGFVPKRKCSCRFYCRRVRKEVCIYLMRIKEETNKMQIRKKYCGMISFLGKLLTRALILGGFLGIDRHAVMYKRRGVGLNL